MNRIIGAFLVTILLAAPAGAQAGSPLDFLTVPANPGYRNIQFVEGQILNVDLRSNVITLLDGSEWLGGGMIILPVTDILIIPIPGEELSVAFSSGMTDIVRLVRGAPLLRSGYLVRVIEKNTRGDILKLSNGDVLELGYDAYRTATWLTPFDAVLTTRKLYNLRKGQFVQATIF